MRWYVCLLMAPLACSNEITSECEDETTLRVCDGGDCRLQPCRGDEVCEAAGCVFWADAALSADFECTLRDTHPRAVR